MDDIKERMEARNGILIVERWQDAQPYLEENARRRAEFQSHRNGYVRPLRMTADIPCIVIEKWLKQGVNIFDRNDAKKVQKLLNSNEYSKFRTSPGKCKVR